MNRLPILLRKLLRDLWRTRAQGATVVMLVALGVGLMVGSLAMQSSLRDARDLYYVGHRLADLQVYLARAPRTLIPRIEEIPGIQHAMGRVTLGAILDLGRGAPPVTVRLVSLEAGAGEPVNRPWLVAGRWPTAGSPLEVLVNEAFANARGVTPGDHLPGLVHGRRVDMRVAGVANSPEFVFASPPGELFPQPEQFAVVWMPLESLETLADTEGAFNDLVVRVGHGASPEAAARQLDTLLARFGAQPAHGRDRIPSARFLDQEIDQLGTMARLLPPAFLLVAAFLLHIVLGRMVSAERANIGLMKAFGYRPAEVAWPYAVHALVLASTGILLGLGLGTALGEGMATLYAKVYRLPSLPFQLDTPAIAFSAGVTLLAASMGSVSAIRRVLSMTPAQALQPPAPPLYRRSWIFLERVLRGLEVPVRLVLRRLLGVPRRSITTIAGLACALALLVLSSRLPLAVEQLLTLTFGGAKRQDVTIAFGHPLGRDAVLATSKLPGVVAVEPFRVADVRYSAHGVTAQDSLVGLQPDAWMERLMDVDRGPMFPRDDGLVVSRALAGRLGVRPGDVIHVQFPDGQRRGITLPVAGIVRLGGGSGAYLTLAALQRHAGDPGRVSGVHARLEPSRQTEFNRSANATPAFMGVSYTRVAEASMRRTFAEGSGFMSTLFIAFSMLMAGGIAYATASVTLAEQRHDLATLKVLGFTNREVVSLLVAEIILLALLSVPLGWWAGQQAASAFLAAMATDLFTFPEMHDPVADLRSAGIVLGAVAMALFLVHRQIDRIPLVESLKSRE